MALTEHNPGGPGGGGGSGNMAALGEMFQVAKTSLKRGDVIMAMGIMMIVIGLIMPLPSLLLDMMLGVSVTVSILILMVTLFISKPLDLSSYPTILLITTLLRLSLNMASTRLILTSGHEGTNAAGHVIEAFANFVMGGDFIIGVIVYGILTIVNFKVITAGSGRIAEVAARFTLDAMPGKQMAIDADLSAGMIDESTARARRKELEDESAFFGSMDGASKFVKGDAVAGLMIMFINIIGGVSIAVIRHGMPVMEALDTFTKLTIGDGLVSQIPALVISISSGFLVSKAGAGGSTDKAVVGQLTGHSSALALSAGAILVLALLPGMPMLTFLPIIGLVGAPPIICRRCAPSRRPRRPSGRRRKRRPVRPAVWGRAARRWPTNPSPRRWPSTSSGWSLAMGCCRSSTSRRRAATG